MTLRDRSSVAFLAGPTEQRRDWLIRGSPTASCRPSTTRIGPYEVRALLGRGGMGEVYRAHDPRLGRDVALKLLPEQFAPTRSASRDSNAKRRLLAALNHPDIATLYGIEESHGQWVLALEFVEGPTLAERLASGRLPLPEPLVMAAQIIDALDTAQEQGIIHRNLKPANITVRPDGTVKVLDFGLAKALDLPAGNQVTSDNAPVTDDCVLIGTTPYMSPEQARGARVDQRTDIWAFGCVLYEMTMRYAHLSPAYLSAEVGLLDPPTAPKAKSKGEEKG